jgi:hypothetical protein
LSTRTKARTSRTSPLTRATTWPALGTDRYPPFTLGPDRLPSRLRRRLPRTPLRRPGPREVAAGHSAVDHRLPHRRRHPSVLVDRQRWSSGFHATGGHSVLNLLVVIAGFFLLITPRGLFDLLIGINRWLYRVLTYVALMRDEYPPFRLDQGEVPASAGPAVHKWSVRNSRHSDAFLRRRPQRRADLVGSSVALTRRSQPSHSFFRT